MTKNNQVEPTTRQIAGDLVKKAKEELIIQEQKRIKKQAHGFMNFVREQGIVGLAVGLSLGTAATVFVKSVVDSMIMPAIGAILPGSSDLASKYYCLEYSAGNCVNKLGWGTVLGNLISFMAVAAVIYFVIKGLRLDKLDRKKSE